MPLGIGLKLFENLRGMRHGLLLAMDVDATVLRRDTHSQRVTDSPHMLIACTKERYKFFGTDNRDVCFAHPNRVRTRPTQQPKNIRHSNSIANISLLRLAAAVPF